MSAILFLACGAVAAVTILAIVLIAVLDWAAPTPRAERLALCGIAAGLVWAGPSRFAAGGLGLGDLVLLGGVLALVMITYGRRLAQNADLADGRADGQVQGLRLLVGWAGHDEIEAELRAARSRRR